VDAGADRVEVVGEVIVLSVQAGPVAAVTGRRPGRSHALGSQWPEARVGPLGPWIRGERRSATIAGRRPSRRLPPIRRNTARPPSTAGGSAYRGRAASAAATAAAPARAARTSTGGAPAARPARRRTRVDSARAPSPAGWPYAADSARSIVVTLRPAPGGPRGAHGPAIPGTVPQPAGRGRSGSPSRAQRPGSRDRFRVVGCGGRQGVRQRTGGQSGAGLLLTWRREAVVAPGRAAGGDRIDVLPGAGQPVGSLQAGQDRVDGSAGQTGQPTEFQAVARGSRLSEEDGQHHAGGGGDPGRSHARTLPRVTMRRGRKASTHLVAVKGWRAAPDVPHPDRLPTARGGTDESERQRRRP
jgi:hypothetical protein